MSAHRAIAMLIEQSLDKRGSATAATIAADANISRDQARRELLLMADRGVVRAWKRPGTRSRMWELREYREQS